VVVDLHEVDGEFATVVLGTGEIKDKKLNKPRRGFFEKKGVSAKKYLKGFRVSNGTDYVVGAEITADIFNVDEKVTVRAKTIGRGFTGTIKRHNFSRGPMAHGSKSHRIPGSIGAGTTPGRVYKGVRMAGHYGDAFVTIKNLAVVKIDSENKLIFVAGAVPGKSGFVEIFS
jgi:large subunit ribosomal protein L3